MTQYETLSEISAHYNGVQHVINLLESTYPYSNLNDLPEQEFKGYQAAYSNIISKLKGENV